MDISYRQFDGDDYSWYFDWYRDAELNRQLGPMDREWLSSRIYDNNTPAFVALSDLETVGVIGVSIDDGSNGFNVISELAINPLMKRNGLGLKILNDIFVGKFPVISKEWRSYVSVLNLSAIALFDKANWKIISSNNEIICFSSI